MSRIKKEQYETWVREFFQENNYSDYTQKTYEVDLAKFLKFILASDIELETLSKENILSWIGPLERRSQQRLIINIRIFLLWLKSQSYIQLLDEWDEKWRMHLSINKSEIAYPLTQSQIKMLYSLKTNDIQFQCLVLIVLETAAKMVEISNLKWKDITLSSNNSYMELSYQGQKRVVPISFHIFKLLEKLKSLDGGEAMNDKQVFSTKNGSRPVSATYLSRSLAQNLRSLFGDENITTQGIQLYAKNKILREKGLDEALKITNSKTRVPLISADMSPEMSDDRLRSLRDLHQRAFAALNDL